MFLSYQHANLLWGEVFSHNWKQFSMVDNITGIFVDGEVESFIGDKYNDQVNEIYAGPERTLSIPTSLLHGEWQRSEVDADDAFRRMIICMFYSIFDLEEIENRVYYFTFSRTSRQNYTGSTFHIEIADHSKETIFETNSDIYRAEMVGYSHQEG